MAVELIPTCSDLIHCHPASNDFDPTALLIEMNRISARQAQKRQG